MGVRPSPRCGVPINNLWYADEVGITADNLKDLQRHINSINQIGNEYGLRINTTKMYTLPNVYEITQYICETIFLGKSDEHKEGKKFTIKKP